MATAIARAVARHPGAPWALAGLGLVVVPYVVPRSWGLLTEAFRDDFVFIYLASLIAFFAFFRIDRVREGAERRFWALTGVSFLFWAADECIEAVSPKPIPFGAVAVADEALFVAFYLLFAGAADFLSEAHAETEPPPARWFDRFGTALFVVGLLFYFVVVPGRVDPKAYLSEVPSTVLYVVMDLFLLGRFAICRYRERGERRRRIWTLLICATMIWAATDVIYMLSMRGYVDLDRYPAIDLFWYLPFAAVLFAILAREDESPEEVPIESKRESARVEMSPLAAYAVAFPVLHLVHESAFGADSPLAEVQRVVALAMALLLGALAALHQRALARSHIRLAEEVVAARRRLATTERLEAVGRLAAGVAHDFNNLLTIVQGRVELLLAARDATAHRADLEDIRAASHRAAELTQELLAVGRRQIGVRRALEVNRFLGELLPRLEQVAGPRVRTTFAPKGPPLAIETDPGHLERILSNLVANARDAMPEGGTLTLSVERRRIDPVTDSGGEGVPEGVYAAIAVADTGVGMDEAIQRRIFEPFFTTKPFGRGSGLGLSTVYGLVRQNRGHVTVDSRPGDGSRFELLFPLAG